LRQALSPPRVATRAREPRLSIIAQALLLGALQGPAELLPISSSGHVTAVPWLLGWSYPELDGELRKSFEVALHAGSALAVLLSSLRADRGSVRATLSDRSQLTVLGLAAAPAALAGLTLERPIERRLGRPRQVALGLLVGSVAMVAADRAPQDRDAQEARAADALWLGLAQACALVPGISRNGATLAAARARHFSRRAAWQLSARVATPVLAGAAGLRLIRLARSDSQRGMVEALAAGAGASLGSSLLSARLLHPQERNWPLWPFVAYRSVLGLAITLRRPGPGPTARRCRSASR
jgi:undecaprenyl-diphosphatase